MSKQKFFYVLADKALSFRLAKTQTNLFQFLRESPGSDVKAFNSLEEAQKYLNHLQNMYPSGNVQGQAFKQEEYKDEESSKLQGNGFPQNKKFSSGSSLESLINSLQEEKVHELETATEEKSDETVIEEKFVSDENEEEAQGSSEKRTPYRIYALFSEDEEAFEKAKDKINASETYHLFFDGACSNNPGPTGVGYALYDKDGKKIYSNARFTGMATNSIAEYNALIFGLKSCQNLGVKKLDIYGDSQLVVNHITGKFKVSTQSLWKFYYEVQNLLSGFKHFTIQYIPREQNVEADKLSKKGLLMYHPKKP